MEPIKHLEDFFFKYYQNFKAKHIEKLSLRNIPQPMIEPPIIDEVMIEPKSFPSNHDKSPTYFL